MSAQHHGNDFSGTSLETVMSEEVAHAAGYEHELSALERDLSSELKETRRKIALYNERRAMTQDYIYSARKVDEIKIPHLVRGSEKTIDIVHEVEWKLPTIRSQLMEIRKAYDLGQRRAQTLQAEMEWKAKTDYQRWRSTLLGKSPLSPQQVKREWLRLLRRSLFVIFLVIVLLYICWVAIHRGS